MPGFGADGGVCGEPPLVLERAEELGEQDEDNSIDELSGFEDFELRLKIYHLIDMDLLTEDINVEAFTELTAMQLSTVHQNENVQFKEVNL